MLLGKRLILLSKLLMHAGNGINPSSILRKILIPLRGGIKQLEEFTFNKHAGSNKKSLSFSSFLTYHSKV